MRSDKEMSAPEKTGASKYQMKKVVRQNRATFFMK